MKHRPELPQPPPGYVARPRLPAARAAPPRQRPQKDKPTPDIDFIQIGNSGVAITIRQGKGAVSLNTNEQRFIYNSLEANESHSWICAELLDLQKRELRRQNKKSLASAIPLEMIERLRSSMSERIGKHPRKENGHWEKVQKPYGPGEYQTARAEDLPKAASATAAAPDPQHSHQASSYPDLYDQPSYPQPSYLQPSYPEPSYPQPSYLQPSYPQPSHQASSYPEPPNLYDRPSYRPSHHKPSPYEPSARQESAPQPINPRVAPLAGAPAAATENILPSIGEVLPREFPQSQRSRQGGRQGGYTSQSQPPRQLEPVSRAAPAQPYYQPSPYQQPAPRGPEPQPMVPQAAPFAGPPTGPWPAARENRLPSLQQALPDVFPQSQHSRQGDRQGGYTSQSQRPRQLDLVSRPAQAHPSRTSLAPPPALTGSKRTKSSSPGSTGDSSLSSRSPTTRPTSSRGDRSRDDRFREERPREERHREDRPRDDRPRDDRSRQDRPRDDRSRQDRPRDDRPRDDRSRQDRPRDDGPRDDRPRQERPRDDRSRHGHGSQAHKKRRDDPKR
ncbi:MAG: hypothetical protein HETSPECPRED_002454 [Heterodermia speciosa]|uniref:Uncharacterized protein n=1 Tax=Heterodermia speciosa TaxID=116794 RepID=A0A8H3J4H4_9LECA|nr:MAG: hypothetical protein HETSPECPRED_002454 [Heterodermia speciosa]